MSEYYKPEDQYSGDKPPSPNEDASARKIIADYLDQVKARLPQDVAKEVIPELRSHLLEQASQPSGKLTSAAAWDAIVSMGSPDIVAKEFRRESETADKPIFTSFLDALQPRFRSIFWWIVIGIVVVDLILIAFFVTMSLISLSTGVVAIIPNYLALALITQVWVFAGIVISYLVMLLFSHPTGAPIFEIIKNIVEREEVKEKEKRVTRTQRRVQKRVRKFDQLTGRSHLLGKLVGHIIGVAIALVFAVILPILVPSYPAFDIQVIIWLAVIGLSQAGLTAIRVLVGKDTLPAARLLASLDVLYGLVGIWIITLFFFGPLAFPFPYWNGTVWTLFNWKPFIIPFSWLAPLLVLLIIVAMAIEIIQVNVYIQPLYNDTTIEYVEEI